MVTPPKTLGRGAAAPKTIYALPQVVSHPLYCHPGGRVVALLPGFAAPRTGARMWGSYWVCEPAVLVQGGR